MTRSLLIPFGLGVLSVLSPCVLPLIPGYLSFLAGTALDTRADPSAKWRISRHAFWFVCGSGIVLIGLGVAAAAVGAALNTYQIWVERVGGVLLVLFGLALIGWLPIPFLSTDHRIDVKAGSSRWWRSGLIGMAFGLSWSACAGPVLGAMFTLTAVQSARVVQGVTAMLAFALGQGLIFLGSAIFVDPLSPVLRRVRRVTAFTSYVGATVVIGMGVLLISGQFNEGFE